MFAMTAGLSYHPTAAMVTAAGRLFAPSAPLKRGPPSASGVSTRD